MAITCAEVTYSSSLFMAVIISLVGYLSPYWQVDRISKTDSNVEIAVGLNYACVKEEKRQGEFDTSCKPIPLHDDSYYSMSSTIDKVRWLITCHVIFMLVSAGLSMAFSIYLQKSVKIRRAAAIVALLSLATGISGLVIFSKKGSRYQRLFEAQFSDVDVESTLVPGASFYLSSAGCSLFGLVFCVELYLRLWDFVKVKRQSRERKLLLKDEINYVYGSAPFFLNATSSLDQNGNKISPLVETCHVDIFRAPVHNKHAKTTQLIYTWD